MKYLVLGGGSLALFATLGKMKRLYDEGHFQDLQELSGASAGSMAAVAWALFGPRAFEKMMEVDTTQFFKMNLQCLMKHNGLSTMDGCRSEFIKLVGTDKLTLSDLYNKTGLKVHIAAYSLEKNTTEYFSVDNAPDMKLLDALCMSCCVPILFVPQNGYIDGGVAEKLPMSPFLQYPKEDIYGLRITFQSQKQSYFKQLMSIFMSLRYEFPYECVHDAIDIGSVNVFDFKMSSDTKHSLFLKGYSSPICTA